MSSSSSTSSSSRRGGANRKQLLRYMIPSEHEHKKPGAFVVKYSLIASGPRALLSFLVPLFRPFRRADGSVKLSQRFARFRALTVFSLTLVELVVSRVAVLGLVGLRKSRIERRRLQLCVHSRARTSRQSTNIPLAHRRSLFPPPSLARASLSRTSTAAVSAGVSTTSSSTVYTARAFVSHHRPSVHDRPSSSTPLVPPLTRPRSLDRALEFPTPPPRARPTPIARARPIHPSIVARRARWMDGWMDGSREREHPTHAPSPPPSPPPSPARPLAPPRRSTSSSSSSCADGRTDGRDGAPAVSTGSVVRVASSRGHRSYCATVYPIHPSIEYTHT